MGFSIAAVSFLAKNITAFFIVEILLMKNISRDFMTGFYVQFRAGVSLYVWLYGNLDVLLFT